MRVGTIAFALLLAACGPATSTSPAQAPDSPAPAEQSAPLTRWDVRLLEMMPFIDACIAKSPETRTVTFAAPTGEALVTVRLAGADASVDCTLPDDDPNPTFAVITPRREAWQAPGENAAIFARGPGENPGGECYAAPEVRGRDGELLGWMMDPEGC